MGNQMEIWKEINDVKGYQVSSLGRIKNPKGKLLTGSDKDGYVRVCIQCKLIRLHRIVAKHFVENPDSKLEVNHKDGNKKNNRAENLEWSTRTENMRHAVSSGLHVMEKGENSPKAILTKDQVNYIRQSFISRHVEFGQSALGRKFGVSNSCIWRVVHGDNWRNK